MFYEMILKFIMSQFEGTVNFNHYFGCQKCTAQGVFDKVLRGMSFPNINGTLRNDDSFRSQRQPNHHKTKSLIEKLPVDMIRDFITSDPLHLLELGIMKKYLRRWTNGERGYQFKWQEHEKLLVNAMLVQANYETPSDIHRAVRVLQDLAYWKGTEYRSFLLYFGIIVLKDVVSEAEYNHFLWLFCAVRICSSDHYAEYIPIANILFNEYNEGYCALFGQ